MNNWILFLEIFLILNSITFSKTDYHYEPNFIQFPFYLIYHEKLNSSINLDFF